MDRVQFAVTPIADEEGVLILRRELRPVAEANACRRAWPDVADTGQVIGVIGGVLTRAVPPAELAAARHEADARRSIPRRVHIPFHVGVVAEQFALRVVSRIVLVAEADAEKLDVLAVRIDVDHEAARPHDATHEVVAIGHPRQQVIFAPNRWHFRRVVLRHLRLIATNEREPFAIGVRQNRVRAVFATRAAELHDHLDFVQRVVVFRRCYAVKCGLELRAARQFAMRVGHHVQRIERPQQALGIADVGGELFDLRAFGATEWRYRNPVKRAVLIRCN